MTDVTASPTSVSRTVAGGDAGLRELLARLTLEQKVRLLTGADTWSLYPEPAAGLRRLVVSDGPAGVRGEAWDARDFSANLPCPTALAASWDEARVRRLGRLLAGEARRKGVDVLLAPTVNLHRSPYGGRHFECYSEDPLLTGRIGAAYVTGLQASGVGGCVKHFVANDAETERMRVDVRAGERTLHELYLAPFDVIVNQAGVWSVMAAYNGVNGSTMTESPLLRSVLHEQWGFDGVVMSDWHATRSVEASARAALDLAMPGPESPWTEGLLEAVRAGRVAEELIDDKVLRLLRLAARVGALEGVEPAAPRATPLPDEQVSAELRGAAAAGFVLARNHGQALPLERAALRRLAVVGPNAAVARTLGGGSATVFPPYTISPLEGLRAALDGHAEVVHSPGVRPHTRVPVAAAPHVQLPDGSGPGVEIRFLTADGGVLGAEARPTAARTWTSSFGPGIQWEQVAQIELRTRLRAGAAGDYTLGCSGVGHFRLTVGGRLVLDTWLELPGDDLAEVLVRPPQRTGTVHLDAGEEADLVLLRDVERGVGGARYLLNSFQLNLEAPYLPDDQELARAEELARGADAAVVVVGTNAEVESEGFDRDSLGLPGRQDELVRRVAAANPRTVVVVNSGAPVLMPWLEEVGAVLLSWFPGQEFGNALADVLLGEVEPGGRLPTTWPAAEDQVLATRPENGHLTYAEGIHIGYRRFHREGTRPLLWFGHGLGYTSWEYLDAQASPTGGPGQDLQVRVRVRNAGARRGREVVQVYASRPGSSVEQPARWLAGFAAVEADPGEEAVAQVAIPARALEHWDEPTHAWTLEPGEFQLTAAPSAGHDGPTTTVRMGT